MEFLSNNRAAGLALMGGVALIFIASLVSVGGLSSIDAVNYSDFGATMDMLMDNAGMHQSAAILFMLAVILMAFGVASLLRLSHRHTLADFGLRLGAGAMLFAWGVYTVQIGIQYVIIEAGEDSVASTALALITGVHFGFIALGALGSFLIGIGVAARFDGVNLFVIAGYGLALMGVAEAANLVISTASNADLGLLLTINNVLLALGGLWLFIIGFGIYRGEPALTPQGAEE